MVTGEEEPEEDPKEDEDVMDDVFRFIMNSEEVKRSMGVWLPGFCIKMLRTKEPRRLGATPA